MILDAAGLCIFTSFPILDIPSGLEAIPKMMTARYGWDLSLEDWQEWAKGILKTERGFNQAAGLTSADDRLPDFFTQEPLAPHKAVFDVPAEELDQVLDF
jgi:aldehyde:ferredoxin oxidoreductase